MNESKIKELLTTFEAILQYTGSSKGANVEFWLARDLQRLFEYAKWENFETVVKKAAEACQNAGGTIDDHFLIVERDIKTGVASRKIQDYALTRYACYLIAQNADPAKESVAFAQTYFAVQTRKLEVIQQELAESKRLEAREQLKEREKKMSDLIYYREVPEGGFGRIRSKGDQVLFGGLSTREVKEKLGMPEQRPLADFLPTVTLLAKSLATEITNVNIEQQNLTGEAPITAQHISSNETVRKALLEQNIVPENLPPAEDIKKIERRKRRGLRSAEQKKLKGE